MPETIKLNEIIFRKDLYPRFEPNPKAIQQYFECIEELPPIQISDTNILIDGYHRWKAYETAKQEVIPCEIIKAKSEEELYWLSVRANAAHGLQLSTEEKRSIAIKRCGTIPDKEIYQCLSIPYSTFRDWTKDKREEQKRERNKEIYDLWLGCYAQQEIGVKFNIDQKTVSNIIDKFRKNGEIAIIPKDFEPQLYDVWNFHKATNEVKHPGNIPPEIVENLLYYYTEPFDIIFDPFGGGGTTIDVCKKWNRRYYVSDFMPIPARAHEMRRWDLVDSIPKNLPNPKLTFLDPPYFKKKKDDYEEGSISDLNREDYLNFFKTLASNLYKKHTPGTYLALLMSNFVDYNNRQDSIWFDDYANIFGNAGFSIDMQIQCPLSTQQYKGFQVTRMKEKKELMIISRELVIWKLDGEV